MKHQPLLVTILAVIIACCVFNLPVLAEEYPSRPITLYIPFSMGGTTDISARMLAKLTEPELGVRIILENKPGGGSVLMHELIARAAPDGYTLGILTTAALTRLPHLRKVDYDPFTDFTPVMVYGLYQHGLCVPATSPWQTFEDFIAYAENNPGLVTYSTAGAGSGQHLVMEYIASVEGIQWTNQPYPGGVEAVGALLNAQVTAVSQATEWLSYVNLGRLRLLAVYGVERIPQFPDVRTLKEIGYDYALISGLGIVGPARLTDTVAKRIYDAFSKAAQQEEFQNLLNRLALLPYHFNQEELTTFLKTHYEFKGRLIKQIGLGKDQ